MQLMFEEADAPLFPVLIKAISKWDWMASDLVKWASLINATDGISTFAIIDILEEDISLMTQH